MSLCECINCDDPDAGGECLAGFCASCLSILDSDEPWGTLCDDCQFLLEEERRL